MIAQGGQRPKVFQCRKCYSICFMPQRMYDLLKWSGAMTRNPFPTLVCTDCGNRIAHALYKERLPKVRAGFYDPQCEEVISEEVDV